MSDFWQTFGGVIILAIGFTAGVYSAHENETMNGARMHYLGNIECSKNDFGNVECRELEK